MKSFYSNSRLKQYVSIAGLTCILASPGIFASEGLLKIQALEQRVAKIKNGRSLEEQSDALYDLGYAYFEAHDYKRAEQCLCEALEKELATKNSARASAVRRIRSDLAEVLIAQGRLAEAEAQYKDLLTTTLGENKIADAGVILDNLAKIALKTYNFADVESYSQRTLDLARKKDEPALEAKALINLALVERYRARSASSPAKTDAHLEQGLKNALKAVELLAPITVGNAIDYGNALCELGKQYCEQNKFKEALVAYDKALEVYKEENDKANQAEVYLLKADVLYESRIYESNSKRITEALESYKLASGLGREWAKPDILIMALLGQGVAYADLGNFDKAKEIHEEALSLAKTTGHEDLKLKAILQLSNDWLLQGFPEPALFNLLAADKNLPQGNDKGRANLLTAIGRCYKMLGETEVAIKYYQDALKLYKLGNDQTSYANTLLSLAVACLDSPKHIHQCENYFQQAKEFLRSVNDKYSNAALEYNLAQYNLILGKYPEATAAYDKALQSFRDINDVASQCLALSGLGLAQLLLKNPEQALSYYKQAQSLAESSGAVEAQWDSNLGLGIAYKALKQLPLAAQYLKKSTDLVEQERGKLSRDSFKMHNLDFRKDCFLELTDVYFQLNKPYEALEAAERGKARAFLDLLANRKSSKIDFDELLKVPGEPVQTNSQAVSFNKSIATDTTANTELDKLAVMAKEAGTRSVTIISKPESIIEPSAISPVNVAPPSIEEIQTIVKKHDSTCLEYFLLPEKIIIWVIHPDSSIYMVSSQGITQQELRKKISLTRSIITKQPKSPEELKQLAKQRQEYLKELYKVLIAPVKSYLPKDKDAVLTIIPHGPIFSVPFAALMAPDNSYFIESHPICYTPAIGVLRATQKLAIEVNNNDSKLLAFGNPITQANSFLGALPYAEKEVKHVAELFGISNTMIKVGTEATKNAFQELAPLYSDIHLATHGLIDEEHPVNSAVILAPTTQDDGRLTVKDILALKHLKARMVVLSACQTGRGKITGDGVVGLSRAFITAGTSSILVSQWNVDDVMTEFQMKEFYKSYLKGQDKAKSLRDAQLATIAFMEHDGTSKQKSQNNSMRANPRYWAAFQLIGEHGNSISEAP